MMTIWYRSHFTGQPINLDFEEIEDARRCWDILSAAGCYMICKRP